MGSLHAASGAVWGRSKISSGGPNIVPQLQDLLSDPESLVNLKLEIAVIIDFGEHFVKATYFLEGDGPLVFSCYEKLQAVAEVCQAPYFPNVRSESESSRPGTESQDLCTTSVQWFLRKFNVDLNDAVKGLQSCKSDVPRDRWLVEANTS